MEKRMVLRSKKNAAKRGYKMWRITQGVLRAETGMIRLHLYSRGKLVWHSASLCRDMPAAEVVANRWMNDGHLA